VNNLTRALDNASTDDVKSLASRVTRVEAELAKLQTLLGATTPAFKGMLARRPPLSGAGLPPRQKKRKRVKKTPARPSTPPSTCESAFDNPLKPISWYKKGDFVLTRGISDGESFCIAKILQIGQVCHLHAAVSVLDSITVHSITHSLAHLRIHHRPVFSGESGCKAAVSHSSRRQGHRHC
jgi:hypothetical protein